MERITSKNNALIKDTKKLLSSSRARAQAGLFVLEGARLCLDVLHSVYRVRTVLLSDTAYEKLGARADALIAAAQQAYLIGDEAAAKLGDTDHSQGVFAVCEMTGSAGSLSGNSVLALDNVQDPANLGAMIRTAEALGTDVLLLYNCCDLFNPKTLRASMGGVLRINAVRTDDLAATLQAMQADGYRVYATVPDAAALPITRADFSAPCVCVIGNEANGVETDILALADERITIPMAGRAESLNAAAAAAITMWEMQRK